MLVCPLTISGCKYCVNPVSVSDPPSTKVTSPTGTPTEGKSTTLTCDITDGRPHDGIKKFAWKKGSTAISSSSSRYQLSDNNLIISSLDRTLDEGHYSCAAENDAGMGHFSATFHLLVNCEYSIYVWCSYK